MLDERNRDSGPFEKLYVEAPVNPFILRWAEERKVPLVVTTCTPPSYAEILDYVTGVYVLFTTGLDQSRVAAIHLAATYKKLRITVQCLA